MQKSLLQYLGYTLKDNAKGVYSKTYQDSTIIEVDFDNNAIHFGGIKIYDKETQNITKPEDRVVFECIDRLLTKGYKATDIMLEKVYPTGRGTSGRLDILVKKEDKAFLMIECKTRGGEFEKEYKKMQKDGGQLFTYFQQDRDSAFLMLYTSQFDGNNMQYKNEIVKIEDSYRETSNVEDLYVRRNKLSKTNGVFESWVNSYHFESKALTKKDLVKIRQEDSSIIFNRFLEILRHNTVSDKPNAFNKMFTLFLCKIYDEGHKGDDEELEFQFIEGVDDDVSFQVRLTDLYKRGMMEFLKKEITDFNTAEFNKEFGDIDEQTRNKILHKITKLRLEKNNEFAIKEVFDADTFKDNAVVLKEVVELLQSYQIRYAEKQPFLGDFFELLLTTGLKQESGQFFTPVPVARFICKSIPLDKIIKEKLDAGNSSDLLPSTIDYAAGSGHFLTESMEEIQNIIHAIDESKLKPNVAKEIKKRQSTTFDRASEYMYGIEKDYRLVKTAKVGCYLHGDGIATVIHGDGLDSFSLSKTYRGKLTIDEHKEDQQLNEQFDLVLSNPPYSVSAFKGNLDREKAEKDFDLYASLTDRSSEIECLFIERTKQLLKDEGIAALILPSSILSNSGIYSKAREILLKHFDILSIVSLGSGTFMATGTNTVVLFMRKRNKYFARNLEASVSKFFTTYIDVSLHGIECVFSTYSKEVWGVALDDYITLCKNTPNEIIQTTDIYKDYCKKFSDSKIKNLTSMIIEIEKEKMLYFILAYNQEVVLVKSGEKQVEKEFLGYEFSARKGSEGIHPIQGGKLIDECTKLFDPERLDNETKVSTYIYDAFCNTFDRCIHADLKEHITRTRLVDLMTFNRAEFEKTISTNVKKKDNNVVSKWELVKLGDLVDNFDNQRIPLSQRERVKGEFPYYGATGIVDYVETYIFDDRYILIGEDGAKRGANQKSAFIVEGKFWVNNHAHVLKPKKNILDIYLVEILNQFDLSEYITGLNVPKLNQSNLNQIKIPLPPLHIQQQIAYEIEVLERKEQEHKEKIEGLRSEISNIIGEIHGEIAILSDICDVRDGTHDSPKFYAEGFPLITGKNLINGKIDFSNIKFISKIDYDKINQRSLVEKGDILFGMIGTIGNPVLVDIDVKFAIKNVALFKFETSGKLSNKFFRYLLDSQNIKEQLMNGEKGATQKFVGLNVLRNLRIPLPPLSIQQQIVTQIESIEQHIYTLEMELAAIPSEKQAILTKYL